MKILAEMSKGKNNEEIAQNLNVSIKTVQTHIYQIYSRLNIDSSPKRLKAVKIFEGEKNE